MFNKKVFEVYLNQEGENYTIHTEINANTEPDGLITKSELEQIKNITLNMMELQK